MRKMIAVFLILFAAGQAVYAADCNVDVSDCSVVLERFFFEEKENKINSATFYYDRDDRLIMRTLPDSDGSDRFRAVYVYDNDELVESSCWSRSGGVESWNRDELSTVEKTVDSDKVIYTTRSARYRNPWRITSIVIKDPGGRILSEEHPRDGGWYSYRKFNSSGDLIFYKYEHEKSGGLREERYEIEYDETGNKISTITFRDGVRYEEEYNSFNADNLLTESHIISLPGGEERSIVYEYNKNGQPVLTSFRNSAGAETFAYFFEYDEDSRLYKRGERYPDYERYWLYEYLPVK